MTPVTKSDQATVQSRPRVTGEREEQILDATLEVLSEVGYDRLTMDAVAASSKASKATLYRRWSTKADLVVDALVRAKCAPEPYEPDTGTLRDDLIAASCRDTGLNDQMTMSLFAGLVSALQHDAQFSAAFHERFLQPMIAATVALFERARDRGEIADHVDLELFSTVLPSVALHRTFILGLPTDESMVRRIVDEVVMPAIKCASRGAH